MRRLSNLARAVAWLTALAPLIGCEGPPPPASQQEALATHDESHETCTYFDTVYGKSYQGSCVVGAWPGRGFGNQTPPTPPQIGCPDNAVVTGLWGRSGDYLDHLGVKCAWIQFDETLGPSVRWNDAGGNGGGEWPQDIDCPAGWAANGILGTSGASVDSIGLDCAPFGGPSVSHSRHDATTLSSSRGGGAWYEVQCGRQNHYNDTTATNLAMKGDYLHGFWVITGKWINGIVPLCDDVD